MKKTLLLVSGWALATSLWAAPMRVALMDFEDQTGQAADQSLGGAIKPGALAAKGVMLMSQQLLTQTNFTLIDRRDFIAQIEKLAPRDMGRSTPTKPSFIHAAQALRADAVLRGSLLSFSSGKQVVNQGGYKTDFSTLSCRVSLEALDPVDGSVIVVANGTARGQFRQTDQSYTVLSEDDAVGLLEKALNEALPRLQTAISERQARAEARPKLRLSVKTSADPAMVEIDGILVGTTPLERVEVYQGDHVLTIGKPGYRDITKRILFERDAQIEVPMMRTELTAEEQKDILEKIRLNVISVDPGMRITPLPIIAPMQ